MEENLVEFEAEETLTPLHRPNASRDARVKKLQRQQIIDRVEQLKTTSVELQSMSVHQLEVKLSLIEHQYEAFERVQGELEHLDISEFDFNYRTMFENSFGEVKALLLAAIAAARSVTTVDTLSSTRIVPPDSSSSLRHLNLPKLQLTRFSGRHREWLDFFNMFSVLIHNNTELTNIEKFQYLRSCLTDDAARLVQALEVTAENYHRAIELLTSRYDNKRYIFQAHLKHIFNVQTISTCNVSSIREFVDAVNANLRAMQSLASRVQIGDGILLHLITSKLDQETQTKWEEEVASKWDCGVAFQLPTWEDLSVFLERRCQTFDIIEANRSSHNPPQTQRSSQHRSSSSAAKANRIQQVTLFASNSQQSKCKFCNTSPHHNAFACSKFMELSPMDRYSLVKRLNLCLNCLAANHMSSKCPSLNRCQHCHVSHHTLLHRQKTTTNNGSTADSHGATASGGTSTVFQISQDKAEVLLGTAHIQLCNSAGVSIVARALLDSASQLNFITERMAQHLRVPRTRVNMDLIGIGANITNAHHVCSLNIKSLHTGYSTIIDAVIIPAITACQPRQPIHIQSWNIPKNVNLADPTFNKPGLVDCLLGASIFYDLLLVGQIKIQKSLPLLQKTKLGWIVSGPYSTLSSSSSSSSPSNSTRSPAVFVTTSLQSNLDASLERFWNIENNFSSSPSFSMEELECETFFRDTTRRCPVSNKFIVRLPFKIEPKSLGQSLEIARKRFLSLENRLSRNPSLHQEYAEFIDEYIKLHHMIPLQTHQQVQSSSSYYIPHHCVVKADSTSTKLRVVFDASCRTSTGKSLNDILRIGPTIQDDLFTILSRFRSHKYVLVADIVKMYRQIMVDKEDAQWQRILWRKKPSDPITTFQLQTVTYGTCCAPYLAVKCLQQLAKEEALAFPVGSAITLRDFYVDNLMTGSATIEETIHIKQQVIQLLEKGGFPLRKFAANHPKIIEDIPLADREETCTIDNMEYIKALGLRWSPSDDNFFFGYNKQISSKSTKRSILSHIASFFDPLGILNPIILSCKIFMQLLWKLKMHWDESLPQNIVTQWESLHQQFADIGDIRIPRFVAFHSYSQIHAFSDASTKAYGACIYVVSNFESGAVSSLLCAKSRVAPTKEVSLPRLELCAALLLAELLQSIIEIYPAIPKNIHCWTDSSITLAWIKGEPSRWNTFVANRVTKIQTITSNFSWRHVSSAQNPADLVSRGSDVHKLKGNTFWFHGPEFIRLKEQHWPIAEPVLHENPPEQRKQAVVLLVEPAEDLVTNSKFINNYNKLLRIFAYVNRFIARALKKSDNFEIGAVTAGELNSALQTICGCIQQTTFREEIKNLQSNAQINRHSKIASLSPFLHEGLIRVGGRIRNSSLSFEAKHPILLPHSHPFIHTLIRQFHRQHHHAGCQTLLNILRDRFWIVNGRNTVKQVIHSCIICFRCRPKVMEQVMASLPQERVTQSYPFEISGVDYCGPLLMTSQVRGRAPAKVYIAVFICFTTKAVHLELAPNLTTDAFIAALKRFTARRGKPNTIFSDNATNFIGANRELRELLASFNSEQHIEAVQFSCREEGITWRFIPPRSPHFGGLWESAVKQAKHYLRRSIGTHILNHDELHTLCCQVEAIVNSRPLTPLSNDPDDLRPLTPAHFLVGRTLTCLAEPSLLHTNTGLLKRYQLMQWITQQFWNRWYTEYLKELQQKTKWKNIAENLQINDLVLLKDDNLPPLKWILGRVIETIPGCDGQVRVAVIKTAEGIHKRAITKICKLPLKEEPPLQ